MRPRLTPARRRVLDRALEALLELDVEQREARLQVWRRRYPRLAIWLADLVRASTTPTRFLKTMLDEVGQAVADGLGEMASVALPPGTRLGAWRLLEVVGSGGMGTVYRAERADGAFEMQAAAKLIRVRHDRRLAERLRLERQLLARLDHAGIARILDGGTTEDDQSWLVMDWVTGEDLSTCAETLRARPGRLFDVFAQVCRAVEHAHQRRVVHGDIKPANIRLTPEGQVRLLDFGVARLVAEEAGEQDQGALALTPAFSAPEQAAGQPASTQSDVWSLGVLLFWLLTGERLARADRPSLERKLKGRAKPYRDLAAMIATACATRPEDRYQSVSALRMDVERSQALRPVQARDHTMPYVFGRLVRRNPLGMGLGALLLLVLLAGLAGTSWQAHVAGTERDRAWLEAQRTARVSKFLVDLFEHADPFRAPGDELTAGQLLAEGRDRIDVLEDAPLVQAEMYRVLGQVHYSLGDYEQAEGLSRAAIDRLAAAPEASRPELAQARIQLGRALAALGRTDEAESALREAVALAGDVHARQRVDALSALGMALRGQGRLEPAEETLMDALALQLQIGPDTVAEAEVRHNLGYVLFARSRYEQAREQFQRSVSLRRELLGEDHPLTWSAVGDLGHAHGALGDLEAAENLLLDEVELQSRNLGPDHPHVGALQYGLGILRTNQGRHEEALEWFRRSLATRQVSLSASHPSVGLSYYAIGAVQRRLEQLDAAAEALESAVAIYEQNYDSSHPRMGELWLALGNVYRDRGDVGQAEALLRQTLEARLSLYGPDHQHVGNTHSALAGLYLESGDPARAMDHADQALESYRAVFDDEDHPNVVAARDKLDRIAQKRRLSESESRP